MADKNKIRRDIYSVKVWDTACGNNGAWCHNFMTYNREKAVRRMKDEKVMLARSGYPPRAKLVHPAQWVVEAYTLHNGAID
jgi:hypothetical protein